jgi:hypothetical protein
MKKEIIALGIILLSFTILNICLAGEKSPIPYKQITLDARIHASSNPDEGWKKGRKITLNPGVWEIRGLSGGWSCWESDSKRTPDVSGAWTWNLYIKMPSEDRSFCFGVCSDWWRFRSAVEAESFVKRNVDTFLVTLNEQSDIYFWIYDAGPKHDNRGKITIEISSSE